MCFEIFGGTLVSFFIVFSFSLRQIYPINARFQQNYYFEHFIFHATLSLLL
jgi:hypothetical protein